MAPSGASPFPRVERRDEVGSTSTELVRAVTADPDAWPPMSVLVARSQVAGRGRAGRTWSTPPGEALTASVLLRPRVPAEHLAWVTLLAGLAVVRAVAPADGAGPAVGLKWPNDVVVGGAPDAVPGWGHDRKVAGILTEAVPVVPGAVVVGIGVNLRQRELPVPWATSLALAGLAVTAEALLARIGGELAPLVAAWEAEGPASLRAQVRACCTTIGAQVRVDVPGGRGVEGRAVDLDADGALVVAEVGGARRAVLAGDVRHLRRT
ncbi:biotin--[acetyl-CoA-carboxylase] ligase [Georgenia faecalis]|uniref:biotin--[biotin carboxyl-carrier protein] ligase n=1 Tax=Georgenia faecalis TaxID=2483799 RepID=A0ABV9D6R1_9MICO|nr:biotin--[acetyl-CoA-carboxylase] ligase [Georgenia faecalis]